MLGCDFVVSVTRYFIIIYYYYYYIFDSALVLEYKKNKNERQKKQITMKTVRTQSLLRTSFGLFCFDLEAQIRHAVDGGSELVQPASYLAAVWQILNSSSQKRPQAVECDFQLKFAVKQKDKYPSISNKHEALP